MQPTGADSQQPWPWWRCAVSGLCALALALSGYLSWHYLVGGSVVGCGGGSSCDHVLSSRWSAIGGVLPVSGLAAGTYLAMLVASFFVGPRTAAPDRRLAWGAMVLLGGAAVGSAVWFIIVQKWQVGAFCPWCMATHTTGVLLAVLVLWRAPRQFVADPTDGAVHAAPAPTMPRRLMGARPVIGLAFAGIALAGVLAICQLIFTPPAVYRGGETQPNSMPMMDPHAVPLVGSPDAPYVVKLLFDYKCPHCQKLHAMLDDVIHRYDGKVAFALCPAPLNNQCNPYIAREVDEFKDSCALAKLGLAVWVAKREAFADFDAWMFSPEPGHLWQPRSLDAATAKAVELVGQATLDAAKADPWIDKYMHSSIQIYGDTILPDQSGNAVPKLVFGSRWVTPEPDDADELVLILHDSLKLPRP